MKLHIECLQEKIEGVNKEREILKREIDKNKGEALVESDKLGKVIKGLEEELKMKGDKVKLQE